MNDRVTEAMQWGVAYPAGVVVVAVVVAVVVGVQPTAAAFLTTIVAAIVGLVALHDPQSPRRRAYDSVSDDADDDGEDVADPAASLSGHGSRPDPDDEPAPGQFDDRSLRLALFSVGLFLFGWLAFFLARGA